MQPRRGMSAAAVLALCVWAAAWPAEVGTPRDSEVGFRFAMTETGGLGLWEGGRPVLVYNHQIQKRDGVPADRQRSSYVHPLHGIDGEAITDDFPKDHYHHRGLFWAWPHIGVGDQKLDLWTLRGIRQQFERWSEREAGRDAATLGVENGWYVGERRVLREAVRFRIAAATAEGRTIDVDLELTSLDQPIAIWGAAGKSYGGLSLRFAPRRDTVITTPDGRQSEDLNLARLPWADLSATFAGAKGPSGAALFVDPKHADYPPTWITRAYGFLGVGWPGTDARVLPPGKTTTLRYRIWLHRGVADAARLRREYAHYTAGK